MDPYASAKMKILEEIQQFARKDQAAGLKSKYASPKEVSVEKTEVKGTPEAVEEVASEGGEMSLEDLEAALGGG